jgi:hypothetical protein
LSPSPGSPPRGHGFGSIRTAEEYRERVPLQAGEDLAPWVDRIAAGEARVLTRSPVRTLEPTSGSSAAAKVIPYTATLQREIKAPATSGTCYRVEAGGTGAGESMRSRVAWRSQAG